MAKIKKSKKNSYTFIVNLYGLWSKTEEIKINEDFIFKKIGSHPSEADLSINFGEISKLCKISALTSFGGKFESDKNLDDFTKEDIYHKVSAYVVCLRLYQLGAVFIQSILIEPYNNKDPTKKRCFDINYALLIKDRKKIYVYNEKDKDHIDNFMNLLYESVQEVFRRKISKEKINHIFVASEMYNNAFLNIGPIEGRVRYLPSQISFLISALEALFLKRTEKGAITRRLGQRLSIIFGFFGYKQIDIYNTIIKAYDIRSDYYHGNTGTDVEYDNAILDEISTNLFHFVRISIIIFIGLQIFDKIKKEEQKKKADDTEKINFLKLIDDSLLVTQSNETLEKKLKRILIFEYENDKEIQNSDRLNAKILLKPNELIFDELNKKKTNMTKRKLENKDSSFPKDKVFSLLTKLKKQKKKMIEINKQYKDTFHLKIINILSNIIEYLEKGEIYKAKQMASKIDIKNLVKEKVDSGICQIIVGISSTLEKIKEKLEKL